MKIAAWFPGQGTQKPGMGRSLYAGSAAAREVFDRVGEVVGCSVSALCFDSGAEELARTENSQLAIFTVSLAALAALRECGAEPDACAGYSLGEYTALVASGVLSPEDGVRLVCRRSELMQAASERTEGCMAAILGLPDERVEAICAETAGIVQPSGYNCGGQLTIAGERAAVQAAAAACKKAGARRVVPLAVSGAFHTPLMAEAAAALREFAGELEFRAPRVPVYTAVTGARLEPDDWPAHLERHMTAPVRWAALARAMRADGYTAALELGSGGTLTGFSRHISPAIFCLPVGTMEQARGIASGEFCINL